MKYLIDRVELLEIMHQNHLTQEDVAKCLGISRVSFNKKIRFSNSPTFFTEDEIVKLKEMFGRSIFF